MIAHFLFKLFKKSEIRGITRPHTLLILKYQKTQKVPENYIYLQYVSSVCKNRVLIIPYQHRDDSSVLLFHQITDDFIVEELHRLPLKHRERKRPLFYYSSSAYHSIMMFEWWMIDLSSSPQFLQLHIPLVQPSVSTEWRAAVASHCSSWCKTAQN